MRTELVILAALAAGWLLLRGDSEAVERFVGGTPFGDGSPDPGPTDSAGASFPPNVERWRGDVRDAVASLTGWRLIPDRVMEDVILSMIQQESSGRPDAVGSVGEVGLMQLRDMAAQDVGLSKAPTDPVENIRAGTRFLDLQHERMGGGVQKFFDGIRAYNAGAAGARRSPNLGRSYALDVIGRVPAVTEQGVRV